MAKIICIGLGAYVDAEQIVAVDDDCFGDKYKTGFANNAKATILLKNGDIIPGYVKPETIKKRWQEAVNKPIALISMTAKEAKKWTSKS